ncbi:hypothetical protein WJX77_008910 [Trebouxia sp. C0004]
MQQYDIAGMSGCPVTFKQANYVEQDPSNLLQQSALVVYARLPGAANVWWWTIAVGSFATLLHFLAVMVNKPQATAYIGMQRHLGSAPKHSALVSAPKHSALVTKLGQ